MRSVINNLCDNFTRAIAGIKAKDLMKQILSDMLRITDS